MLEADVLVNIYTSVIFSFFIDIVTFRGEEFTAHLYDLLLYIGSL